jgi:hypothetical protein
MWGPPSFFVSVADKGLALRARGSPVNYVELVALPLASVVAGSGLGRILRYAQDDRRWAARSVDWSHRLREGVDFEPPTRTRHRILSATGSWLEQGPRKSKNAGEYRRCEVHSEYYLKRIVRSQYLSVKGKRAFHR